jgi:type IV secretory pathway VirB4 component
MTKNKMNSRPAKQSKTRRHKSVQEEYIRGREAAGNMLCIASAAAPTRRRYVTILRVDGLNYGLLSRDEQRSVTTQFSALVRNLGHAVQFLVRILPHNITAYEREFLAQEALLDTLDGQARQEGVLAHMAHLRQLDAERGGLLDRSHYIIIPADQEDDLPASLPALFERLLPGGKRKRSRWEHEVRAKAQQQLTIRVQEVQRQLTRMGLQTRRLEKRSLIRLYHSCVLPRHAARCPLPDELTNSIDHLSGISPGTHQEQLVDSVALDDLALQQDEQIATPPLKKRDKRQQAQKLEGALLTPFMQFADLVSPAGVKLSEQDICFLHEEREYKQTLIPFGVPREMPDGWFRPLIEMNEPYTEISLHVSARPPRQAMTVLRQKQNTSHAKRIYATKKGNLLDADTQITERDVNTLVLRCASGEDRMQDVSLYVQVSGATRADLRERASRVLAVMRTMQLEPHPAFLLHDEGYRSCMPEANNPLALLGTMFLPASSLGAWCPFISSTIQHEEGIWLGQTPTGEPVHFDRWDSSLQNANWLVDGPPGYGKSYFVKLWAIRRLLKGGVQCIVVDPEREWKSSVDKLQGQWIRLAAGSGYRINPLDLYHYFAQKKEGAAKAEHDKQAGYKGDRLAEKVTSLLDLFQIMLARRSSENAIVPFLPEEIGFLEQVIFEAYRRVGITSKSNTYGLEPPLLRDVYDIIEKQVFGPDKFDFLPRLYPFVHGSYKAFFDGPTNVSLDASLVVFDTRDLDSRLTSIVLALISEYVWTQTFSSDIPREFIIDEAGVLASGNEAWARFMSNIVARARKHWLAVTLIMQSIESIQKSEYGKVILGNCDTRILFARAQTNAVQNAYGLSDSEAEMLRMLGPGESLMLTPKKHIVAQFVANAWENELATTNARELAQMRARRNGQQSDPQIATLAELGEPV